MHKPEVIERSGTTPEEILQKALEEFNLPEECIQMEVLEEAKDGFLGFGKQPAKARLTVFPDRRQLAFDFVDGVLGWINKEAEIEVIETEDSYTLYIEGPDVGNVIGKRGQTLNALQYLANIATNRFKGLDKLNVIVDVSGYRESRSQSLLELADSLAEKVLKSKRTIELEPMNAAERKIIHIRLRERNDVHTWSEGEEPNRKLIISYEEQKAGHGKTNGDKQRPNKPRRRRKKTAKPLEQSVE
jgi:spoIIIJ-associated protein